MAKQIKGHTRNKLKITAAQAAYIEAKNAKKPTPVEQATKVIESAHRMQDNGATPAEAMAALAHSALHWRADAAEAIADCWAWNSDEDAFIRFLVDPNRTTASAAIDTDSTEVTAELLAELERTGVIK